MADANNPKVVLKKKQIPVLVDFCLDESIEFSVKQQTFPETDWEIELKLKDMKTAIVVGMFLRENRLDIEGIDQSRYKKSSAKKADEKPEVAAKQETATKNKPEPETEENQSPTLM
jgi:hypothetical protein